MTPAERLKLLRIESGYTQAYIANTLGICKSAYSRYESGTRTPNNAILKKIQELYNISDELLAVTTIDSEITYSKQKVNAFKKCLHKYDNAMPDSISEIIKAKKDLKQRL